MVAEARDGAITLELAHAFGSQVSSGLRDPIRFVDDQGQFLVQPVGRHVAAYAVAAGGSSATSSFALGSPEVETITACAVSRSQRLLAACGRSTSRRRSQVALYDLARGVPHLLQSLEELGGMVGRIACAAFSTDADARYICVASAEPELLLVMLEWRRNLAVGMCKLPQPMDRIALNPLDGSMISASGPRAFHIFQRAGGAELVSPSAVVGLPKDVTYSDHVWLTPADNTMVVCAFEGPAFIVDAGQMRAVQTIQATVQPRGQVGSGAHCVRGVSRGFVVGGARGTLALWEKAPVGASVPSVSVVSTSVDREESMTSSMTDLKEAFQHTCTASTRQPEGDVMCLDVADLEADGKLAVGFADGGVGVVALEALRSAPQVNDQVVCSVVCSGCHAGPVTALDVATQRPLVVTACRKECSVRVWNHAARRCDLSWEFPGEELTGIAVHPLGFFLAVSCSDRLRFMQILANELKAHREVAVRGIRLLRFSSGGHLLAAVQGKLILVFSSRSLTKVATLRGHTSQVVSISFEADDRHLVAGTDDGSVCGWSTSNWSKVYEHASTAKSVESLAVSAGADGLAFASILEAPSRCSLRTFRNGATAEEEDLEMTSRLYALWQHQGARSVTVLAGTSAGSLWACCAPFTVQGGVELSLHTGSCTAVCLSADARTVATAGEDGTVFILNVGGLEERDDGALVASKHGGALSSLDDGEVVMINRGEIQKRQEELQQLSAASLSLKAQLLEEKQLLQNESKKKVSQARQADQVAIHDMRLRYESIQQVATVKERENLRHMRDAEAAHVARADALEADYGDKIRHEADHYVALNQELARLRSQLDELRAEAERDLESRREKRMMEARRQLDERDGELHKLKKLISFTQERFDVMLDQEAIEYDQEIKNLKRQHQQEMEDQRAAEYRLKKEQDTLLRGLDMMEKERERITREQSESSTLHTQLRVETEGLQRDVDKLKVEQRERELTLKEKEQDISQYKAKVNTLKKFKQVLDFRLREVKLSLQPKDDMIEQLTAQLRELEAEFERQLDVQKEMEASLEQRKSQIVSLSQDGDRLREEVQKKNRAIKRFQDALEKLVCEEQDVRRWPDGIKVIYAAHVNRKFLPQEGEALPIRELGKQIALMERKAESLKRTGESTELYCKADKANKRDENQALIEELEELRAERHALQRQVNNLHYKMAEAEHRQAQALKNVPSRTQALTDGSAPKPLPERAASACEKRQVRPPTALSKGPVAQRTKGSTAPPGQIWKTAGKANKGPVEQKQMQKLLAIADLNQQQLKMQKLEHKLLEDQLQRLQFEAKVFKAQQKGAAGALGSSPATPSGVGNMPAGAGMAAVRRAGRMAPQRSASQQVQQQPPVGITGSRPNSRPDTLSAAPFSVTPTGPR